LTETKREQSEQQGQSNGAVAGSFSVAVTEVPGADRPGSKAHSQKESLLATDRQMKANQRNARHSTGPRTPEGKIKSRQKAVTHGLIARKVLLAGEDPEEYRQLHEVEMRLLLNLGARSSSF
jgi:hypothetical protein